MAQYRGSIQGSRGETHRLGTKSSGIEACVASWDGAIVTELWWDSKAEVNKFVVRKIPWHGSGPSGLLLEGIVGE